MCINYHSVFCADKYTSGKILAVLSLEQYSVGRGK